MNRRFSICCIALALLASAGLIAARQLSTPDTTNEPELEQPKTTMQLRLIPAAEDPNQSTNGASVAYDYFSGEQLVHSIVEYESGASEDLYYRNDGSKEWSRDYFSLEESEKLPLLRSVARFAKDGKTYVSHDVKRRDGSWERRGKLLADGNYQQTYYCLDGITPEKTQLFNKNKGFLSESSFSCQSGRLASKYDRNENQGSYGKTLYKVLTRFNPDGSNRLRMAQLDTYEVGLHTSADVFDDKGELVLKYSTNDYNNEYKTYSDGKLVMNWIAYKIEEKIEISIYHIETEQELFTLKLRLPKNTALQISPDRLKNYNLPAKPAFIEPECVYDFW